MYCLIQNTAANKRVTAERFTILSLTYPQSFDLTDCKILLITYKALNALRHTLSKGHFGLLILLQSNGAGSLLVPRILLITIRDGGFSYKRTYSLSLLSIR